MGVAQFKSNSPLPKIDFDLINEVGSACVVSKIIPAAVFAVCVALFAIDALDDSGFTDNVQGDVDKGVDVVLADFAYAIKLLNESVQAAIPHQIAQSNAIYLPVSKLSFSKKHPLFLPHLLSDEHRVVRHNSRIHEVLKTFLI